MASRGAQLLLVLALASCAVPVRREVREAPVEAGVQVPFSAPEPRRWEFGDGTPPLEGATVQHAFSRAGRYVVRGFEGKALRDELSVVVRPRSALRLVPSDASFALVARALDELAPLVDFGERLGGPEAVERVFDTYPLLAWAFEQASAPGAGAVDPLEGVATWSWDDASFARLSVVGVRDDAAALAALREWLPARGWTFVSEVAGLTRYEQEERSLDLFVDRGALYAVDTPLTARLPGAQARLAAGSALGLELDGPVATALDQLPSGGLVVFARAPEVLSWRFLTAAVRLSDDEAHLEGRLQGRGPLWAVPRGRASTLLSRAPEGPVLVASASLPPSELAALLLGAPGAPRRKELELALQPEGMSLERVVAAFTGSFELGLYADVPGFVRGTLRAGGRPVPAGTLLFEAPITEREPVQRLVAALGERWGLGLERRDEKAFSVWRGRALSNPVEIALTAETLFAKAGSGLSERESTDLAGALTRRFEGAFGPGHASLFVDLGQLRRELLQPRLMDDVDPRRALTAQALAVTIIDRFTQLDSALLDLAPSPDGASVQVVLKLRPRER